MADPTVPPLPPEAIPPRHRPDVGFCGDIHCATCRISVIRSFGCTNCDWAGVSQEPIDEMVFHHGLRTGHTVGITVTVHDHRGTPWRTYSVEEVIARARIAREGAAG